MHGGHDVGRKVRSNELSAVLRDPKAPAQQGLSGGRTEADEDLGPDDRDLCVQPGAAGRDLYRIGLLVDTALSPRLPFEVLHRVGHVGPRPVDAGNEQGAVEQRAGGTDERPALQVLPVSGLLADDSRRSRSFPEDRLGTALPERTSPAARCGATQPGEARTRRHPGSRGVGSCSRARHGVFASIPRASAGPLSRDNGRRCPAHTEATTFRRRPTARSS